MTFEQTQETSSTLTYCMAMEFFWPKHRSLFPSGQSLTIIRHKETTRCVDLCRAVLKQTRHSLGLTNLESISLDIRQHWFALMIEFSTLLSFIREHDNSEVPQMAFLSLVPLASYYEFST
jgi:hypothetical protein